MKGENEFLKAMLDEPTEETKGIFCDWLEEAGDPRAEILRYKKHDPELVPQLTYFKKDKWLLVLFQSIEYLVPVPIPVSLNDRRSITYRRRRWHLQPNKVIELRRIAFDWKTHAPVREIGTSKKLKELPLFVQVAIAYYPSWTVKEMP